MKSHFYRPSPAMIVALIALFVALGGAGMAATGGNFILGQSNSANATSSLSGTTAGPQLKVSNASSSNQAITAVAGSGTGVALFGVHPGSSGSGAAVQGNSASAAAPGVLGQNSAGGPGLQATVNIGAAPLSVNSSTRVDNLNADLLDGLTSSTFQRRVTGACTVGSAIGSVGADGSVTCNKNSVRPGYSGGVNLSVSAHHCVIAQLSVSGAAVGDSGIVAPNAGTWSAGLIFQVLRANQAGKLPIDVCNPTDVNVSSGNQTVSVWVVKLTP
jgi:hypothetical protein